MNENNENQLLKKKTQDKKEQKIPNKINIDEYLKNLQNTRKNVTIIRKPQKPIDTQKIVNNMLSEEKEKFKRKLSNNNNDEDNFENTNIRGRRSSVANLASNLDGLIKIEEERKRIEELRKKRMEERKKFEEEQRIIRDEKRKKEEEEKLKKEKEERIKREKEEEERLRKIKEEKIRREKEEEERRKREEEERKQLEEERRKREEEKKLKEEERKKREEERKKREEEEKIKREKEEEERKKREEEFKKLMEKRRKKEEEERKKREEQWKREEEERKKRKEERKRKEEERKKRERKKREEEERKKREEEERKEKEQEEKLLEEHLSKINKKKEELNQDELGKITEGIHYKNRVEIYKKITYKDFDFNFEGKHIQYNFEEIKKISTEKIINLEVTNIGKIIVVTSKGDISNIIIYNKDTYELEKELILDSKINSFVINKNKIYCSLDDSFNNILIIDIENTDERSYLNGHNYSVTGVCITYYNYLVSADINGNIVVWKDNKIKKTINDFHKRINTISEINENQQRIAILSFDSQQVKFYDLRYPEMEPLATIENISGSGLQNNMLRLNQNMLAISGTYIYIIDINSFLLIYSINCIFANDSITTSLKLVGNKAYFFVSQAMTNNYLDEIEKGTIGYYEYEFINTLIPDYNTLLKIGEKTNCHDSFITSIRVINSDTFVSASLDGKIKFCKLKKI